MKEDNSIKALLFDLGKVLIDYDHMIIINRLAALSGKSPQELKKVLFSLYEKHSLDIGENPFILFYKDLMAYLKMTIAFDEFKKLWCDIFSVKKNMVDFITDLRKYYTVFILSNINEVHYEYIENNFAISRWVDEVFVSCKERMMKPDKRLYAIILKKIGFFCSEIIFIDDKIENIDGANSAGMKTVLFCNDEQLRTDFEKFGIKCPN
ncbi:HAD family hydrolase [Chlamydiota bacterium]